MKILNTIEKINALTKQVESLTIYISECTLALWLDNSLIQALFHPKAWSSLINLSKLS